MRNKTANCRDEKLRYVITQNFIYEQYFFMFIEPSKKNEKMREFSFCATPKTLLVLPSTTRWGVHAIYVVEDDFSSV
jgi:hypothetical protein